jgi:hypothetical protein
VILETHHSLQGLLRSLEGVAEVVLQGDALPAFDFHCPLMSLPLALGTTLQTVPSQVPYLVCDPAKSLLWRQRIDTTLLKVGLTWSGGFRAHQPELWAVNERRNIPLAAFASLRHPKVQFYSLQKGGTPELQLADLVAQGWDGPELIDWTALLDDFSDTAALVQQLDLVISVDTSMAHLAGALGKPVWILNRYDSCWRWLLDRTDSPWYPTATLYRQERAGDWSGVIRQVTEDLKGLAGRA